MHKLPCFKDFSLHKIVWKMSLRLLKIIHCHAVSYSFESPISNSGLELGRCPGPPLAHKHVILT